MTLILKLDLDMVKMYHHTKNENSMSRHSKVIAQTDTHTDRHTDTHTDSMKTLPSRIRGRNNAECAIKHRGYLTRSFFTRAA